MQHHGTHDSASLALVEDSRSSERDEDDEALKGARRQCCDAKASPVSAISGGISDLVKDAACTEDGNANKCWKWKDVPSQNQANQHR